MYFKKIVIAFLISLFFETFICCQKISSVVLNNETTQVFNIKICRIEEVDTNYMSNTKNNFKFKKFNEYPIIFPYIENENKIMEIFKDTIRPCFEFKIKPGQKVDLFHSKAFPFNEKNICEEIGSIEISGKGFYLKAEKEKVKELFENTKMNSSDFTYEYKLK